MADLGAIGWGSKDGALTPPVAAAGSNRGSIGYATPDGSGNGFMNTISAARSGDILGSLEAPAEIVGVLE